MPLFMRYPRLINAGVRIEPTLSMSISRPPLSISAVALAPRYPRPLAPARAARQAPGVAQSFLIEYFAEKNFPRTPGWQGVRTARWKYTRYTELEGMDELYDLRADPYEMRNVIRDPAAQAGLNEMKSELAKLLKETA